MRATERPDTVHGRLMEAVHIARHRHRRNLPHRILPDPALQNRMHSFGSEGDIHARRRLWSQ